MISCELHQTKHTYRQVEENNMLGHKTKKWTWTSFYKLNVVLSSHSFFFSPISFLIST